MKRFTVICAAIIMLFAFAGSAMALEWGFYGSARMSTFWNDKDEESPAYGDLLAGDDDGTTWDLQSNARIGADVKSDTIGGRFEFAVNDETGVTTRRLYGTWNFGAGELLVGQEYTPVTILYSNQVWGNDEDLLNTGAAYDARRPMVQFRFGGFKLALIETNTADISGNASIIDKDVTIPKVAASFNLKTNVFFADLFGGFNTYKAVVDDDKDYDVNAYVGGLGFGFNAGPVFMKASGYYAVNAGAYGLSQWGTKTIYYNAVDDDIEDNESYGGMAVLGFKAGDKATVEVGGGYLKQEVDFTGTKIEDETFSYYGNVSLKFAPGVTIVPEAGVLDYSDIDKNDVSTDQGSLFYAGIKWQIDF